MSDDKPTVAPGPSYQWRMHTEQNYPVLRVDFKIDMYDSGVFLYYSNAANDLIALVVAKLGQIFSAYELDDDFEKVQAKVGELTAGLNNVES